MKAADPAGCGRLATYASINIANYDCLALGRCCLDSDYRVHAGSAARADLKQRGIKDADKAPIPDDVFRPQAERRVRLGLVVAELVRANQLQAKPEQIKAHVEELAASYEKPADVVRWYYSDRQRLAEVEAIVIENNVTEFVLSKAKTVDKVIGFDELMAANG